MASSETAGGRPGRAWSAPFSFCLGPCSRSLSRANTPSPRLLTLTLRHSVSNLGAPASFGVYLTRCSRAKMYIPGSPSAFLCRVKGHTQYVVRAEEGDEATLHTDDVIPILLPGVCIS